MNASDEKKELPVTDDPCAVCLGTGKSKTTIFPVFPEETWEEVVTDTCWNCEGTGKRPDGDVPF